MVFPVVHINDRDIAVEQADLALKLGVDGVYLINHGAHPRRFWASIY